MTIEQQPSGPEVLVALVGVTGAGKTTFASVASGRTDLEIGHGVDPCTQIPMAVRFPLDGHRVVLVDTPGFDDDRRSDLEILQDIGKWLVKEGYTSSQKLDGLILLHPITLNRVGGMERRRTRLLQAILGTDAYKRVIIATTMWEDLASKNGMDTRINGRTEEGGVWGDMVGQGATIVRHYNNQESTHSIVRQVITMSQKQGKVKPLLETEMLEHQGRIKKTSAGKELKRQLEENLEMLAMKLQDHLDEEPNDNGRKSKDPMKRREWRKWDKERQELVSKVEKRKSELKQLNSMVFKVKHFFAKLFGG